MVVVDAEGDEHDTVAPSIPFPSASVTCPMTLYIVISPPDSDNSAARPKAAASMKNLPVYGPCVLFNVASPIYNGDNSACPDMASERLSISPMAINI
jgi:hypothetical protein